MTEESAIEAHYGQPGLYDRIIAKLRSDGVNPEQATPEKLAPYDEFHVGGLPATRRIASRLGLTAADHLLDLGCGTGGPARAIAADIGCRVTGIDLTTEFIDAGTKLCQLTGLADRVTLQQGSILNLPFADCHFRHVAMLHVGMNITNKTGMLMEASRILRPGGLFIIYDIMQVGDGALAFPLPWASDPSSSAVAAPSAYMGAAAAAGLTLCAQHDETGAAADMLARFTSSGPANTKDDRPGPFHNLSDMITAGILAPTELHFTKPD